MQILDKDAVGYVIAIIVICNTNGNTCLKMDDCRVFDFLEHLPSRIPFASSIWDLDPSSRQRVNRRANGKQYYSSPNSDGRGAEPRGLVRFASWVLTTPMDLSPSTPTGALPHSQLRSPRFALDPTTIQYPTRLVLPRAIKIATLTSTAAEDSCDPDSSTIAVN